MGGHCSNWGCNYSKNRLKTSCVAKEQVKKFKKIKTLKQNPNAKQEESEREKIMDKLNKDINEKNRRNKSINLSG